jgi:hypothetical protein
MTRQWLELTPEGQVFEGDDISENLSNQPPDEEDNE